MRRKSERNKAKGSPEKKIEKPTRRTTRRRGRASPSTSPEREPVDDNVSSNPYADDEGEPQYQTEEPENFNEDVEKGVSSSELIKSVLGGDEEDNGSVWKVARADASPGEIQKLKLCRQRNISEASDSPLSRKKSNKWPDSGEGGMEEADSIDEPLVSSEKITISVQDDDTSSLLPGQDSNQEVSDYKENLPETTSANLSDDKTNIDHLADFKENLPETTTINLSEPIYEDSESASLPTNLQGDNSYLNQSPDFGNNVADFTSGDPSNDQQIDNYQENYQENNQQINQENYQENSQENSNSNDPNYCDLPITESQQIIESNIVECSLNNESFSETICTNENVQSQQESTVVTVAQCEEERAPTQDISEQETPLSEEKNETIDTSFVETQSSSKIQEEEEEEEGEIKEEPDKISPESQVESDTQSAKKAHSRRKHHDKYRESSTPESGDEQSKTKSKKGHKNEASANGDKSTKKSRKDKKGGNLSREENSASTNKREIDLSDNNIEKEDILEINEKSDDLNVSLASAKPAKVSLKRSFSTRLTTDSEVKKQETSPKKPTVNETSQNKENHADNEQPDQKCATKRRRWGVTTSTDVEPAFSISTDSLKALVPGAKPLSVNELKLTKDEDDEKVHHKSKNDIGNHKEKNDSALKNDTAKKGDSKLDNHIARRKITVVKETPRPKSPSPPEAQATNILLIKNLVRPFTLNQIKELLSRTGTIVENGFWMDRIKSKCFVEYANEDQAFETRQALHGVSWPVSNPKKLIVEYATKEDMENARETSKEQPILRKAEPLLASDLWQQDHWTREDRPTVITVIREWDLGKEDGLHVKEKEKDRKEFEKKKRQRSRSPVLEVLPAPARKFKKKEEDPPTAKLLDDLFRKTKSTPCIYWLPLTNEQIIIKEEMRRQHMAENARRLEEMRRAERNRDTRRRRSPRK